jgi:uncharacterized membrane protein (DUF4010 family)
MSLPSPASVAALDPSEAAALSGLAVALGIGLLIGLERGWEQRDKEDGSRMAGLRTFGLIGLLGGIGALLLPAFGAVPLGVGLFSLAVIGTVSYRERVRINGNLSATTTVALLLTYLLGALATTGAPELAAGVGVITAVLLNLKPTLHRWMALIEHRELSAALQMLVLTVVVMPLLPDRGFGPYNALNPHQLWWAVVLVSGLSLAGHVAMRISGPQRGLLWSGLLGGLASSTAATLALAHRSRQHPNLLEAAAAGALAACSVMFVRMGVLAFTLHPQLGQAAAAPLLSSAAVLVVLALLQWRSRTAESATTTAAPTEHPDTSPFDLSVAVGFGLFLGLMAVLTRAAHDHLGSGALYGLAVVSGLADVDALVISVSRLADSSEHRLPLSIALNSMLLAAASNSLVKSALAAFNGSAALGRRVLVGNAIAWSVGAVVALLV